MMNDSNTSGSDTSRLAEALHQGTLVRFGDLGCGIGGAKMNRFWVIIRQDERRTVQADPDGEFDIPHNPRLTV